MGVTGMGGQALDLYPKIQNAGVADHRHHERFGDDHAVGGKALHQTGQGAPAAAGFLLDHALQHYISARLDTGFFQSLEGKQIGNHAGLHVHRSPPVKAIAFNFSPPGIMLPLIHRLGGNHIDMAI